MTALTIAYLIIGVTTVTGSMLEFDGPLTDDRSASGLTSIATTAALLILIWPLFIAGWYLSSRDLS